MENEEVDVNRKIKVEVLIDYESSDSVLEPQTSDIPPGTNSSFVSDISINKVKREDDDFSGQTTGLEANDSSNTNLLEDGQMIPRPEFVKLDEYPYPHCEQSFEKEDVFYSEHPCSPSNNTHYFVSRYGLFIVSRCFVVVRNIEYLLLYVLLFIYKKKMSENHAQ